MFEWDGRKASANRAKHGVSFEEAVTVFADPNALDGLDLRHSETERRLLRLGRAVTGRVLIVAYTLRRRGDGESIRIISARRASSKERAAYAATSSND
jgi:uncharacterized DUF497 family protein